MFHTHIPFAGRKKRLTRLEERQFIEYPIFCVGGALAEVHVAATLGVILRVALHGELQPLLEGCKALASWPREQKLGFFSQRLSLLFVGGIARMLRYRMLIYTEY